jgi:hypothetical protein
MSAGDTNPHVDYHRLHVLSEEFLAHWKRLHAFYLDAAAGFALVRSRVESEQGEARRLLKGTECDSEEFQDTRMFTYAEIFADNFVTSGMHQATQGQVKARNTSSGSNFVTLGQLCIISFYDFWNDYLRCEYVKAKGYLRKTEQDRSVIEKCVKNYASYDLWGDIRLLRQAIVHNRGIATSDIERCKVLKWFHQGDFISITPAHMRAIFLALRAYYNELFSEHFPEQILKIPEY